MTYSEVIPVTFYPMLDKAQAIRPRRKNAGLGLHCVFNGGLTSKTVGTGLWLLKTKKVHYERVVSYSQLQPDPQDTEMLPILL